MKILILEPDEYYHEHYERELAPVAEVQIHREPEHLPQALADFSPDIVIMELLYPAVTGYELLRQAAEHLKKRHVTVIIYTKVHNLEDVKQALNLGVNAYFVKGIDSLMDIKNLILNY